MTERRWLTLAQINAIHEAQLLEHGGMVGIRDEAVLGSAQNRPIDQSRYGSPDLFDLAAAYAFGLSRNHPFLDGNKRTAFACAAVFLYVNGTRLTLSEPAAVEHMLQLSAGALKESAFAEVLRCNSTSR